jgi:hypothetical protein
MVITEDTPEGNPEEFQWKIDDLSEMLKRANDELERERRGHTNTSNRLIIAIDRFDDLTGRLTVGTLRKAGYIVEIKQPDTCDTCGEEF